jgi:hypothetical protein
MALVDAVDHLAARDQPLGQQVSLGVLEADLTPPPALRTASMIVLNAGQQATQDGNASRHLSMDPR